jgi:phosphate starvation-inducible membrane PsiE
LEKQKQKLREKLAYYMQTFISVIFIILTTITAIYLINEIYNFSMQVLIEDLDNKTFIKEVFYLLIIIEVMFIGIKYFSENLHIPKRYFLYIGITTLVKEIFIYPEKALLYSGSILLLVIASSIIKLVNIYSKEKDKLPLFEN